MGNKDFVLVTKQQFSGLSFAVDSLIYTFIYQKQPPEVFYKKRCSEKFRKFHRKTPVLESLLKKGAGLKAFSEQLFSYNSSGSYFYSSVLKHRQLIPKTRNIFKTLPNIYNAAFCKNSSQLKAVNHFAKSWIIDVWQVPKCASGDSLQKQLLRIALNDVF